LAGSFGVNFCRSSHRHRPGMRPQKARGGLGQARTR
jgi:hypothetical protein